MCIWTRVFMLGTPEDKKFRHLQILLPSLVYNLGIVRATELPPCSLYSPAFLFQPLTFVIWYRPTQEYILSRDPFTRSHSEEGKKLHPVSFTWNNRIDTLETFLNQWEPVDKKGREETRPTRQRDAKGLIWNDLSSLLGNLKFTWKSKSYYMLQRGTWEIFS